MSCACRSAMSVEGRGRSRRQVHARAQSPSGSTDASRRRPGRRRCRGGHGGGGLGRRNPCQARWNDRGVNSAAAAAVLSLLVVLSVAPRSVGGFASRRFVPAGPSSRDCTARRCGGCRIRSNGGANGGLLSSSRGDSRRVSYEGGLSALSQLRSAPSRLGEVGERTGGRRQEQQQSPGQESPLNFRSREEPPLLDLNIVLIDNYDSYTYNLYQYLATMCHRPPVVVANDAYATWADLESDVVRDLGGRIDCVIISPGPGTPTNPDDVGICTEAVMDNPDLPILGVCLGHQVLGMCYGADVGLAPCGPVHGMLSPVTYATGGGCGDATAALANDADGGDDPDRRTAGQLRRRRDVSSRNAFNLFEGIPQNFNVVRYHSLTVNFPNGGDRGASSRLDIEPIGWCDASPPSLGKTEESSPNGKTDSPLKVCMALRHRSNPHYGVQFHPESIGSGEAGYRILRNFCDFVSARRQQEAEQEAPPHDCNGQNTNAAASCRSREENMNQAFIDSKNMRGSSASELGQYGLELEQDYPYDNAIAKTEGAKKLAEDAIDSKESTNVSKFLVLVHKVSPAAVAGRDNPNPQEVFEALYGESKCSFWLDSSTASTGEGSPSPPSTCPIHSNSRFSILGDDGGPLCRRVEYFGMEHSAEKRGMRVFGPGDADKEEDEKSMEIEGDILSYLRASISDGGSISSTRLVTFDSSGQPYHREENIEEFPTATEVGLSLPFEYRGGYVGYLGYEARHDTRRFLCQQEVCSINGEKVEGATIQTTSNPNVPTAAFLFADRSLVHDHWTSDWYLVGVASNPEYEKVNGKSANVAEEGSVEDTIRWMRNISSEFDVLRERCAKPSAESGGQRRDRQTKPVTFIPNRSKAQYQADIRRCHDEIRNGESYELCLTNQLEATVSVPKAVHDPGKSDASKTPLGLHKILRKRNPAPFAAFMKFDGNGLQNGHLTIPQAPHVSKQNCASVSICCSSPERFLSVTKVSGTSTLPLSGDGKNHAWGAAPPKLHNPDSGRKYQVESKPIKGTSARPLSPRNNDANELQLYDDTVAEELRASVKNRAENLMIVDLLRNDLSRVCQVGSVHVPRLMHIESYATVHQLVSTIRGTLDSQDANAVDVISACFPGGSMTGAPKLRSVDILDDIEQGVSRGPYSGCLGYVSLNGCMDMNIVIRTAVLTPSQSQYTNAGNRDSGADWDLWDVTIGAGGAITALSECEDEYSEMLLKARAIKTAVEEWVYNANSSRSNE